MAFQTSTLSETAPADATSSSSSSDRSLGNSSSSITTFPLVPAFLISGLLLMSIITLYAWRRRASPNGTILSAPGSRPDRARFMVLARAGYAGAYGAFIAGAPWDGSFPTDTGVGAGDGRVAKKEKDLGPKPEIWDAYLGMEALRKSDAKGALRWRGMKPVTVTEVVDTNTQPERSDDSKARDKAPISRSFWRRAPKDVQIPPRTEEYTESMEAETRALRPTRLEVTLVIMMPVAAKYDEGRASAGRHERLDGYDLVLGTTSTYVPS